MTTFNRYKWQELPLVSSLEKPRTGWPPGLLQDDDKKLSKWLASRPDSMLHAKEAAAALSVQAEPVATVTECEACFTPDVCQLRGTCDHYAADRALNAAPVAYRTADHAMGHAIESVLEAIRREEAAPSVGVNKLPPIHGMRTDFRWDSKKQQHVPQLLVEFAPVPAGQPNDAPGWQHREQLVKLLLVSLYPAQKDTS